MGAPSRDVDKLSELRSRDRVGAHGAPNGPVGERERVPDEERPQRELLLEEREERRCRRERGRVRGREQQERRNLSEGRARVSMALD